MPKTAIPLTDHKQIESLVAESKTYNVNDGKGLSIRVKPNGEKDWIFRYTQPKNGKINNIKLANFPSTSLKNARKIASQYRDLLIQGIDPAIWRKQGQHEALQKSRTINSEFDNWLALNFDEPAPKYLKTIRGQFKNHILPTLGDVPLTEITRSMAIETLSPLKIAGKTQTLKDCCEKLTRFMKWSLDRNYVDANRLTDLTSHFKIKKSEHFPTITPNRMSELHLSVKSSTSKPQTQRALLFQLATLTRPHETVSARWQDIDLTNKVWRIPAADMKMKRPHTVYLNDFAIDLLQQQLQLKRNQYVFPHNTSPTGHMNASTPNCALKRMGYKGELVAHGLRSLASTTMNEVGFNSDHIESSLSHEDENGMRKIYNNAEYIRSRRQLSDWWGNWLKKCAESEITPPLPITKYVIENVTFNTSTQEGQNDDNYYTVGHTGISAQQQVAMG